MPEAVTTSTKSKVKTFITITSFLLALPLASILLVHPALMLDKQGNYSHSVLMIVMLGISGGFIRGVGYIPQFWLWKWLFSPFLSWPLMLVGYYLWLIQ